MKFRHLVRFTRSFYLMVDYDVYRMSRNYLQCKFRGGGLPYETDGDARRLT